MTDDRTSRVYALLEQALDLPEVERQSFLNESCADDVALRSEVESLLAADASAGTFLEPPSVGTQAAADDYVGHSTPDHIGDFRIIRLIGEGGMGRVYEARQSNPDRVVALKVMKRGFVTGDSLRRFEFEAQVLGQLRHANVAQIHAAGTHEEDGQSVPYFALEYVPDGCPITEHARINKLTIDERLEIVVKVCDAVHHGHQRGIIHRDLKPANILLDSEGQPKIIDFGVARAADSDAAHALTKTSDGTLVGTLQYMSPEQCSGDPTSIDTRSDIYALGVILYELVLGRLPFDLSRTPLPAAIMTISQSDPPRPRTLIRSLDADLETIILKALLKDRERRYASAASLADDVRRFLSKEPISARPTSLWYQARMFARRNRVASVAVMLAAASMLSATAISVRFAVSEKRQRIVAERAQSQAEEQQSLAARNAEEALRQFKTATAINDFLQVDLLSAGNPMNQPDRDVTVREIMDQAAARIDQKFADSPLVEAGIRRAIGLAYKNLGEYTEADQHLRRSLNLIVSHNANDLATASDVRNDLAILYLQSGRVAEAEALLVENAELLRREFGEQDLRYLLTLSDLGHLRYQQMDYVRAEPQLMAALDGLRRVAGEQDRSTIIAASNLAALYRDQGKPAIARPLAQEAVANLTSLLGEQHPDTLSAMHNLASIYESLDQFEDAEQLYQRTLELQRAVLGPEHPLTLNTIGNLGYLQGRVGRFSESESLYTEVLKARQRVLGRQHPDTLISMNNLAGALRDQQKWTEAEKLLAGATSMAERTLGTDHAYTVIFRAAWGQCLMKTGQLESAEAQLTRSYNDMAALFGPDHFRTQKVVGYNIELHESLGNENRTREFQHKLAETRQQNE